jgi:hypothetical protein
MQFDGNGQQVPKFKRTDTPTGVAIEFHLTDEAMGRLTGGVLVRSEGVGELPLLKQRMADRNGKPYDIDADMTGRPRARQPSRVTTGSHQNQEE